MTGNDKKTAARECGIANEVATGNILFSYWHGWDDLKILNVECPMSNVEVKALQHSTFFGSIFDILFVKLKIEDYTNCASSVISIFNALLTGQVVLASSAHSLNFSGVIPGTFTFDTRFELLMVPSSRVMVEVVSIDSGVKPAAPNTKLNFIEKQPACAAAINSSGFVPVPSSNRDL